MNYVVSISVVSISVVSISVSPDLSLCPCQGVAGPCLHTVPPRGAEAALSGQRGGVAGHLPGGGVHHAAARPPLRVQILHPGSCHCSHKHASGKQARVGG